MKLHIKVIANTLNMLEEGRAALDYYKTHYGDSQNVTMDWLNSLCEKLYASTMEAE